MSTRPAFQIGSTRVAPGSQRTVELPVSMFSDHTPVTMSVHVVHGRSDGPVLFVSAAIHGDEIIGVEIARRLLRSPQLDRIAGTLMVVPIVNLIAPLVTVAAMLHLERGVRLGRTGG